MKSMMLTEIIELQYWTCHNKNHRHRSEPAAFNCISRTPDERRKPHIKWTKKLVCEAFRSLLNGTSLVDIADSISVRPSTLKNHILRACRNMYRFRGILSVAKADMIEKDWYSTISVLRKNRDIWVELIDLYNLPENALTERMAQKN